MYRTKLFFNIIAIVILSACGDGDSGNNYKTEQEINDLLKKCTVVAGLPTDKPQHKMTAEEMRDLIACVEQETGQWSR